MSKIVFIKQNSPEIREKLKEAGYTICVCASFVDSIWLDYHPDTDGLYKDIHGIGYADEDDEDTMTPIQRIEGRLKLDWYYSEDKEFYETVEEFLEKYPKQIKH